MDLAHFWTEAHRAGNDRWVSSSDPTLVLSRLAVNLDGVDSVLEVGPGKMLLANHLTALGKRVVIHDIATLDDHRFEPKLPLKTKVDAAIAHLVLQHVQDSQELLLKVIDSLVLGGCFYFDAVAQDFDGPGMAEEFASGTSFPFEAWDLVDVKTPSGLHNGYFFCVAKRSK